MMKKLFLSVFVIVTFVFYVIYQKLGSSGKVSSTVPNSISQITESNIPATTVPSNPQSTTVAQGLKDGQYTGDTADAYYGNVQVQIAVSGGKITDIQFLQYPNDRHTSIMINTQAMPYLKQEAIQAQSAQVDIVSGATQTSLAFRDSLQSALNRAK